MNSNWTLIQKIGFRFIFLFLLLWSSPWYWLPFVGDWLGDYAYYPAYWIRNTLLHESPPVWSHAPTGSGDTYDDWLLWMFWLSISILGTVIWSIIDRTRIHYERLAYWFRFGLRYYLSLVMFSYGFHKVYPHQMPFPNLAQLHTPLGDLSPMRLSWLFLGYSAPYEIFGGIMEVIAGGLLIFKRTQLPGAILAAIVMFNVMMFNYCYNIPVKLFSTQLFLISCYLILHERERLYRFFFQQSIVLSTSEYDPILQSIHWKWIKPTLFILFVGYYVLYVFYKEVQLEKQIKSQVPFELYGAYEIKSFILNHSQVMNPVDTNRWNMLVMANGNHPGQSYGMIKRGVYIVDRTIQSIDSTNAFTITFRDDSTRNFNGKFQRVNENELKISGISHGDSIELYLAKINKQFKLEKKPFDWVMPFPN